MKACPVGSYMRGHHEGQNKSICCSYPPGMTGTVARVDGDNEPPNLAAGASTLYTQVRCCDAWRCRTMCSYPPRCGWLSAHACFDNEVIVGVHIGNNYLLCEG